MKRYGVDGYNTEVNEDEEGDFVKFEDVEDLLERAKDTGVVDRKGVMIKFGDTVRFVDKFEWYKSDFLIKFHLANTQEKHEAVVKELDSLPFHERVVVNHEDYEWLLSSEVQSFWETT